MGRDKSDPYLSVSLQFGLWIMMTRIQVKCRRCRMPLLSEEAIVNSHGAAVHGN